jgi:hypothetical protein
MSSEINALPWLTCCILRDVLLIGKAGGCL